MFQVMSVLPFSARETNGSPQLLVYFPPHEREQEVHKFTLNISELAALKIVIRDKRNFPNIAADTVALTKTANKFSQSLSGLIHRCRI